MAIGRFVNIVDGMFKDENVGYYLSRCRHKCIVIRCVSEFSQRYLTELFKMLGILNEDTALEFIERYETVGFALAYVDTDGNGIKRHFYVKSTAYGETAAFGLGGFLKNVLFADYDEIICGDGTVLNKRRELHEISLWHSLKDGEYVYFKNCLEQWAEDYNNGKRAFGIISPSTDKDKRLLGTDANMSAFNFTEYWEAFKDYADTAHSLMLTTSLTKSEDDLKAWLQERTEIFGIDTFVMARLGSVTRYSKDGAVLQKYTDGAGIKVIQTDADFGAYILSGHATGKFDLGASDMHAIYQSDGLMYYSGEKSESRAKSRIPLFWAYSTDSRRRAPEASPYYHKENLPEKVLPLRIYNGRWS